MLRRRGTATFALLVLVAEVVGRSFTTRVDRALHVAPLAPTGADYYPFLLVGAEGRWLRSPSPACSRGSSAPGRPPRRASGCSTAIGHGHERRSPRLRPGLSPRVWLASFVATSLLYLVHSDADSAAAGRWPLFAPWLHTYALPVFAGVSVLVAVALARSPAGCTRSRTTPCRTLARVRRLLTAPLAPPVRRARAGGRRRAAPPLRPRLRVAAASARRLTRGTAQPSAGDGVVPDLLRRRKWRRSYVHQLPASDVRRRTRRAQVVSFIGPVTACGRA